MAEKIDWRVRLIGADHLAAIYARVEYAGEVDVIGYHPESGVLMKSPGEFHYGVFPVWLLEAVIELCVAEWQYRADRGWLRGE